MKKLILTILAWAAITHAQQTIYGSRDIQGNLIVTGTRTSLSKGTTAPATCTVGDVFFDTDAAAGSNWFGCTATNTWTAQGAAGATAWGSITGTLSNQTDLNSALNGKAASTHATQHQNGGGDEVATATAGANAIPKAGAGGTLAAGWVQEVLALADLSDVTAKRGNSTSVQLAGAGTPATDDCAKFDANGNLVSAGAACGAGAGVAITRTAVSFSATPTFTRSSAIQQWTMTLTGNVTSSSTSALTTGDVLSFEFTQDGTGSRTVVLPTGFGGASLISGTASSSTVLNYRWDGAAAILYSVRYSGAPAALVLDSGFGALDF